MLLSSILAHFSPRKKNRDLSISIFNKKNNKKTSFFASLFLSLFLCFYFSSFNSSSVYLSVYLSVCLSLSLSLSLSFFLSFFLLDIDECNTNSHNCDVEAVCNNTHGSFVCTCKPGYTGDGRNCTGTVNNVTDFEILYDYVHAYELLLTAKKLFLVKKLIYTGKIYFNLCELKS